MLGTSIRTDGSRKETLLRPIHKRFMTFQLDPDNSLPRWLVRRAGLHDLTDSDQRMPPAELDVHEPVGDRMGCREAERLPHLFSQFADAIFAVGLSQRDADGLHTEAGEGHHAL